MEIARAPAVSKMQRKPVTTSMLPCACVKQTLSVAMPIPGAVRAQSSLKRVELATETVAPSQIRPGVRFLKLRCVSARRICSAVTSNGIRTVRSTQLIRVSGVAAMESVPKVKIVHHVLQTVPVMTRRTASLAFARVFVEMESVR